MVQFSCTTAAALSATMMMTRLTASSSSFFPPSLSSSRIVERLTENDGQLVKQHHARRLLDSEFSSAPIRKLEEDEELEACDLEFLDCLSDFKCVDCFAQMQLQDIDWTGVTRGVTCSDVVSLLNGAGHCTALKGDTSATANFCDTFQACVIWDDDDDVDDDDYDPTQEEGWVNCTALTQCKWPGMKESWIGDSVCHENMHGCYNTAVCDWDGGDCCKDTCDEGFSQFKQCGQDGFACRDPASIDCDPKLSKNCPAPTNGGNASTDVKCKENEQKYRLILYDSFGDGWDGTNVTLTNYKTNDLIYRGSLKDGSQATEYICLPNEKSCVTAVTSGGSWGVEVSWEVKSLREGTPAIAAGGAPSKCQFPIAGGICDLTCTGKDTIDTPSNSDYSTLKKLSKCIEDKCVIQVGNCKKDEACNSCFVEKSPDYCYALDSFNAVIDCTMCSCTDRHHGAYCKKMGGPGTANSETLNDDDDSALNECSGAETMDCVQSVMDFTTCTPTMDATALTAQFDQSNFGQLDQFERCAHEYADAENHGGHRALNCMGILHSAMTNPTASDKSKDAPVEAIAALAKSLYEDAENFCDCAKKSSDSCTLCPAFMNFKTLLYESLDACSALDEIDCAAWEEFSAPCQSSLVNIYKNANLETQGACDFVKDQCGGVGAFPAFRHLNCRGEIDDDAWDFYMKYEKNCLRGKGNNGSVKPTLAPAPAPSKDPVPAPASTPTLVPYIPSDDDIQTKMPYLPAGEGKSKSKSSHWFRNLVMLGMLGGAGYYVYKKRFDSFNFTQYRRVRNFGNFGYDMHGDDSGGLYSNLNSSTTFEPPTLPPTPQMMGNSSMFGGAPMFGGGSNDNDGNNGHGYMGATEMT